MRPHSNRPGEDELWKSLASVAQAYGIPAGDTQQLATVLQGLDLGAISPDMAQAVAETLAYVYALDEQAGLVSPRAGKKG